ncbi:hypothetical protein IJ472_07060 [bacterium]|nr:hypothetical protein [bacterium]
MQVNNSQPSFGSTLIKGAAKTPVFNNKYTNVIDEYFTLSKTMFSGGANFHEPQKMADAIDFSTYGFATDGTDLRFVGKDGGPGGADTFIGRILKQAFPNDPIEYIDDVAPIHVDGPVIDMTEIGKFLDETV